VVCSALLPSIAPEKTKHRPLMLKTAVWVLDAQHSAKGALGNLIENVAEVAQQHVVFLGQFRCSNAVNSMRISFIVGMMCLREGRAWRGCVHSI
jgi:hypothetical protein